MQVRREEVAGLQRHDDLLDVGGCNQAADGQPTLCRALHVARKKLSVSGSVHGSPPGLSIWRARRYSVGSPFILT